MSEEGNNENFEKKERNSDSVEVKSEVKKESMPGTTFSNQGSKLSGFRDNPWMLSTIVLAAVLILGVGFLGLGPGSGGSGGVGEDVAAGKLVSFIESQSQTGEGDVSVLSSERDGELYRVTVDFQGQEIPVFVSLDGQYLIADIIPLDPSLLPDVDQLNAGGAAGHTGGATGEVEVLVGGSPMKGNANAPVTIVEFSDYQCPFCKNFFSETLSLLEKNYIDTGKVNLVYKDFPLSIHPQAQKSAEAARCVGDQKGDEGYFEMHDLLFIGQGSLSSDNYKTWARSISGIDGDEFDSCLDSGKFASDVLSDFSYGQSLGVTGTPAFFVNGKLVSGAQPYSAFEQLIEAELGL
jgi:protein-disulfide isomerase